MKVLPISRRRVWQLFFDAALIAAAWRLAYFLRFDKATPIYYRHLLSWQVFAVIVEPLNDDNDDPARVSTKRHGVIAWKASAEELLDDFGTK